MRGALLPDALLAVALAFALSYAAPRDGRIGAGVMVVCALIFALVPLAGLDADIVFAGGWLTILGTAACVHLPGGTGRWLSRGLAVNAGLWAGLISHVEGGASVVVVTAPLVLLVLGGQMLIRRNWGLAIKVAASWLIAIAVLEIGLMFVPTAGYEPDHMD